MKMLAGDSSSSSALVNLKLEVEFSNYIFPPSFSVRSEALHRRVLIELNCLNHYCCFLTNLGILRRVSVNWKKQMLCQNF